MIIVILGTGINKKGKVSKDTIKRLNEGFKLYEKYKAPIFVSGKYNFPYDKNNPPNVTEAEAMRDYLINAGVGNDNIILDKESQDTVLSAYQAKKFLISKKEKEIIVVTSDIHLRRVEYIFDKIFGENYNLHFLALPSSFPCGGKDIVMAKQDILTKKVENLLKDVRKGDHESAKEKVSQLNYQKEKIDWSKEVPSYRKTC